MSKLFRSEKRSFFTLQHLMTGYWNYHVRKVVSRELIIIAQSTFNLEFVPLSPHSNCLRDGSIKSHWRQRIYETREVRTLSVNDTRAHPSESLLFSHTGLTEINQYVRGREEKRGQEKTSSSRWEMSNQVTNRVGINPYCSSDTVAGSSGHHLGYFTVERQ